MSYVSEIRKKIGNDVLLLAGSNVIILDDNNRILLQKRKEGTWGLLGGLLEIGETLEETAKREVYEESRLEVEELRLLHVFSGPKYHFVLDNKDEIYCITALYYAGRVTGEMEIDNIETFDLQYFDLEALPDAIEREYQTFIQYFIDYDYPI